MKSTNKKGQIMQNISALGVGVAVLVIILAVAFLVMAQLKTQTIDMGSACANTSLVYNSTNNFCCDVLNCTGSHYTCNGTTACPLSNAMNATQDLTNATQTIPGWVPLIILVVIGGIVLGLVAAFRKR